MSDNKKENLFAKLAGQAQARAVREDTTVAEETPAKDTPPSPALPPEAKPARRSAPKPAEAVKGTREDPAYCQANAYVPKTLRRAVNKALLDIDGMDYSTLVTELLRKWLKSRGVSE